MNPAVTVGELIELLQGFDPRCPVDVYDYHDRGYLSVLTPEGWVDIMKEER